MKNETFLVVFKQRALCRRKKFVIQSENTLEKVKFFPDCITAQSGWIQNVLEKTKHTDIQRVTGCFTRF